MACNGGGIPSALVDGEIAGQAAVKHISEGIPLSCYEDTWRMETGTELNTALTILRIADQVMPSDFITDTCMRLAGSRFLEPLIRCRLPLPVDFAAKTFVKLLKSIT
jgi:flavin-dependent dehydrogenase